MTYNALMQSKPIHKQVRNQAIDLFRLIAAFGVVAIHLGPSTYDGGRITSCFLSFAVPYFLIISLYFFIRRFDNLATPRIQDFRLDRLLLPYAAWSGIYFSVRWLKYRVEDQPFDEDYLQLVFFGGAAVHLYFLPLLLLFQVFAFALLWVTKVPRRRIPLLIPLTAALFYGWLGSSQNYLGFANFTSTILQYVFGAWLLVFLQARKIGRLVNVVIGCFALMVIFFHPALGLAGNFQGPLLGFGVAALAINWDLRTNNIILTVLLSCSYGIYLSHFLFLEAYELVAPRLGISLAPYSAIEKLAISSIIVLVSILFIHVVRSNSRAAYLLLGEN
jgi:peptidoglycan/LPS O-acetylase OafA/YrhL